MRKKAATTTTTTMAASCSSEEQQTSNHAGGGHCHGHQGAGATQRRTSIQHRAAAEALLLCRGGRRPSFNKNKRRLSAAASFKSRRGGGPATVLRRGTWSSAHLAGAAAAAAASTAAGHHHKKKAASLTSNSKKGKAHHPVVRASVRSLVEQRRWKKLRALLDLEDDRRREALAFGDDEKDDQENIEKGGNSGAEKSLRSQGGSGSRHPRRGGRGADGNVLHLAVDLSAPCSVLRRLISANPSLASGLDSRGRTPLHVACAPGDPPLSSSSSSSTMGRGARDAHAPLPDCTTEVEALSDGEAGGAHTLTTAPALQRRSSGFRSSVGGGDGNGDGAVPREGHLYEEEQESSPATSREERRRSSALRGGSSSSQRLSSSIRGGRQRCDKKKPQGNRRRRARKLSSSSLRILCDAHPPSLLLEDARGRAPVDLVLSSRDEERERASSSGRPGELRRRTDADVAAELVVRRTERAWTTKARRAARSRQRRILSSAVSDHGTQVGEAPDREVEDATAGDDNEACGDIEDRIDDRVHQNQAEDQDQVRTEAVRSKASMPTETTTAPSPPSSSHQTPGDAFRSVERRRRAWTARRTSAAAAELSEYRSAEYGIAADVDPDRGESDFIIGDGGEGSGEPRVRVGLRALIGGRDDGIFVREDALRMFLGDEWYDDELGEERTCVESDSEDEYTDDSSVDHDDDDDEKDDCDSQCEGEGEGEADDWGVDVLESSAWNVEPTRMMGRETVEVPSTISFVSEVVSST